MATPNNDYERLRVKLDQHQFRVRQILWLAAVSTYEMSIPDTLEAFFEDIHQDCDPSIPRSLLSLSRPASPIEVVELLQTERLNGYLMQIEQPRLSDDGLSFRWDITDHYWVYGELMADAVRAAVAHASERFPVKGDSQSTLF
jgi:hypothetical protein